jgi:hypothetical protein
MNDNLKLSAHGLPMWFSPKHAGEKFEEIGKYLAIFVADANKAKKRSLAKKLRGIQEMAEGYARYYLSKSPVQSVRIMQPSGAIYVILADGREVLVPQK